MCSPEVTRMTDTIGYHVNQHDIIMSEMLISYVDKSLCTSLYDRAQTTCCVYEALFTLRIDYNIPVDH